MLRWLALVALVCGVSFTSYAAMAEEGPVRVYLLAGQSNMDGRGLASELTGELARYAEPFEAVRIRYANPGNGEWDWQPLEPGLSVPPGGYEGATFGPEVGFGHAYAEARPSERLYLIKFSRGGTSLHEDWKPYEEDGLSAQMIRFVKQELAALEAGGQTYELAGMLWHQGESDLGAERREPGAYRKAMAHFVERLREELDAPELTVILGEVYSGNDRREEIREALRDTAAGDPDILFVSSEGLTASDVNNNMGGTHFDTASQIELGRRMAEAALKAEEARQAAAKE